MPHFAWREKYEEEPHEVRIGEKDQAMFFADLGLDDADELFARPKIVSSRGH
jgi:hypothetical protein